MEYNYNDSQAVGTWHNDVEILHRFLADSREEGGAGIDNYNADLLVVTQEQFEVNIDAKSYLKSTDWMSIREAETGTAMPKDVKAARKKARAAVVA